MIYSFDFDGQDSSNYGIFVNSLPPISKPPLKIEKIEIDGRNGDLINIIGYSAYDKELAITRMDENIPLDNIIKWLDNNSLCRLVLSNEPNVYYKAQLIEQIDFSKWEFFQPLKLKFHVQPFKYYKDEQIAELDITVETLIEVENKGNYPSKPIITLEGTGTVELSLNGTSILNYTFPQNETKVIIDSQKEDAYFDGIYKNRNMNGEFILLPIGNNIISWSGTLSNIIINPNSNWI